jgi:hypothetical protein
MIEKIYGATNQNASRATSHLKCCARKKEKIFKMMIFWFEKISPRRINKLS